MHIPLHHFITSSGKPKFSPKKGKNIKNFMFEDFSVGLEASPEARTSLVVVSEANMKFLNIVLIVNSKRKKNCHQNTLSELGSGLDPDSGNRDQGPNS
jgi:hypothetical protein